MTRSLPVSPASRLRQRSAFGAGEDAELDVIDAERGGLAYGGANAVAFERQIADGGADRRAAGDLLDASGDDVGRKGAERPLRGILQVDDVGAGAKRQFGFLGVAHAGEEQGQWNSQPNMPPPPPPGAWPPRRAARRLSAGGVSGRSKPQKSSRAGALCRTLRS